MKKTIQTLLILLYIFTVTNALDGQIIYVAQGANGDGSSWANATGNLTAALNSAAPGTQIWVREGTYYPTTCTVCGFAQRDERFTIPSGVKLFGSFAGTETSIGQRDIAAHPAYLSGDIDQDGTPANNSFTVVYTFNVSTMTEVDGFIITGGNASETNYPIGTPQSSGGGWYNTGATNGFVSSPLVRNCRFENNFAWGYGGAMINDGSFTGSAISDYINCIFKNNLSGTGGGAVYNNGSFSGYCSPKFTNCIFENNECEGSDGGAVFNIGSEQGTCNPVFTSCEFKNNTASHDGGAVYNFGKNGNCSPVFTSCSFENNSADQGGAIYNDGTFDGFSGPTLTGCSFSANTSTKGDGGAMYNSGFLGTCNPVIIGCEFENNISEFAGGAIFNNGVEGICNPAFTNCRFTNNQSITYGGAMYNQGHIGNASPTIANCIFAENLALSAGAIYNLGADGGNANASITNCIFYKNNANVGGAVYANAGEDTSGISSPTITNCIFWENTANDIGDVFRIINGTPTISYSLVDQPDCDALYNGNGGVLNCLNGMIYGEDPLFENASNGDFHLMSGSPAIDAGSNAAASQFNVDLDNVPRVYNGTVDLGPYEYGSMATGAPLIILHPISQEVCQGSGVELMVSATGTPPLSYQWYKDDEELNGATSDTYTIGSAELSDEGNYHCLVTNGEGQTVISQTAFLSIVELLPVGLSISALEETICAGESATLSAQVTNGGASPAFQWFVNGMAFGPDAATIILDAPNDGDTFTCQVTSSESCVINPVVFSNAVTIHVENTVVAALTIAPDEAMPCEGATVTFTATPENGGASPSFQWSVNGTPAGNNSPLFSYIPQDGDAVQCTLTSSKPCVQTMTVSSDVFLLGVQPVVLPVVSIGPPIDTTLCAGVPVSFTATIENGGNAPAYEWQINGVATGTTDPVFTTTQLNDGDEVTCQLFSSLNCTTQNPVLSNAITVAVDSCMVNNTQQTGPHPSVRLYPHPAHGNVFVEISGISAIFTTRLLNTRGELLQPDYELHPKGSFEKQALNLTGLPQGIYYFQIITDSTIVTKRIVVY
ncbi:MAG TPA: DUF5123 domain-containing protein [Bacteroidetes bacterium]|nr:DUF5123 domain-containing protein [Bacteroidota bacterium]